jgi:hypothetical protein
MTESNDNSVLTGAPETVDVASAAPANIPAISSSPTADSIPAVAPAPQVTATPDASNLPPNSATPTNVAPPPVTGLEATAPPKAAGVQSVWKNIAMGAIYGLAGAAGQKHFGGGLGAGAAGVIAGKQQEVENAQRAQQLQFESVKAADSHIIALDEHRRADELSANNKIEYKQKSAEYQNFLQDNFGIEPDLSFADNSTEAHAGMQTLAQQNGGLIPPVVAIHQPEDHGAHGQVSVYSPSAQQLKQNANGYRDIINTSRRVQGMPDIDNTSFNLLGLKGQRDAAQTALAALKPTPAYNLDKNSPAYLPVVLAQRQQQLDQYSKHKDENGAPDADPAVEKQLQNGVDYLQNAWDSSNKMEADQTLKLAPAQAEAARQKAVAEQGTPQGKATLAKTQQETESSRLAAEKTRLELGALRTGNSNLVGQDYLNTLPAARQSQVRAIGEGRVATNSRTFSTAQGQALLADVAQSYPGDATHAGFDQTRAESYAAMRKDFTSGPTSKGINALNTVAEHLHRMYDNAGIWSQVPGLKTLSALTGGEAARLNSDKQAVAMELDKAWKGGSGVLTEGEAKEWETKLDSWSPPELRANLKEIGELLKGKLGATQNQWENGMPPGVVAPVTIMSPASQTSLDHIAGKDNTVPVGGRPIMKSGQTTGYVLNGKRVNF